LPERVLARAKADSVQPILGCQASGINVYGSDQKKPDTVSLNTDNDPVVLFFTIEGSGDGDVVSVEGVPLTWGVISWYTLDASSFVVGNQYTLNYNGTACYVTADSDEGYS
jgi:hypothetical protein